MVLLAAPPAFALLPYRAVDPRARRVHLSPARNTGDMGTARQIFVDGHVVGEAPEEASVEFAPCYRPGGLAVSVNGVVSGGYTLDTSLGYVKWPGYAKTLQDEILVGVARDGSILTLQEDQRPYIPGRVATQAYVERQGRRVAVGPAETARIRPDGTVLGTAIRNGDGSYAGAERHEDAVPEAFVWKEGRRRALGRWFLVDCDHAGTLLGEENPPVFMEDPPKHTPRLFLWRNGRETTLDTRGLPLWGSSFLRNDGSVVVGLHGDPPYQVATSGVAILRDGKAERVPAVLSGVRPDWDSFSVDAAGRIIVPEGRTRLWQVVRSPRGRTAGRAGS